MDVHTPEQRRRNMAAIKGRDTKPEMLVRRLVHRLGFRYVLHSRNHPGRPDLLLPKHRKAIFVHGCFWHVHSCRYGKVVARTNADFWKEKRLRNAARDRRNVRQLRRAGYEVLVVWECQIKEAAFVRDRLMRFLNSRSTARGSEGE